MEDRIQPSEHTFSDRLLRPFQEFASRSAASGILLSLCTVAALAWANSPWSESYAGLWQTKLTAGFGSLALSKPLILWINDGLMAVFFFVVGLEIKREVLAGELSSLKHAALPLAGALGGMIVPALIYTAFNAGGEGARGWGIPMATDIAFALGALALLGDRVPLSLKVFLTALAIVDDIGAVLVIAVFYTSAIWWASLAVGFLFLAMMTGANLAGFRHPLVYILLGIALWIAFLKSGVHATVAGVLMAMTIPSRSRIEAVEFVEYGRGALDDFERAAESNPDLLTNQDQQAAIHLLENACELAATPLQRMEHALHPWVSFFIMPVFALANAGVALDGRLASALVAPVSLGVIAGLVLGKQIGITLFSWLAVRTGFAALPEQVTWRQIYGVAWLGGIGFTMSLFIANLAFGDGSSLSEAKLAILTASLVAGVTGWLLLRRVPAPAQNSKSQNSKSKVDE